MSGEIKESYKKYILMYLIPLLITLFLYPVNFMNETYHALFLYWGVYFCQLVLFKRLIKRDLMLIIGVITLNFILNRIYIFIRIDIMLACCFAILTSYYVFKSESKYKWIRIISIILIIPLFLSININMREDKLINDRGLERRVKQVLQDRYNIYEEELTLSNLQKIDRLNIWNSNNVYDLQGIENLKNLKELHIDSQGIKNLEYLSLLNNLKELSIYQERLDRLSKVKSLESLEKLRLSYVQIDNGCSIINFPGMKELSIHKAKFKDLSFIKELKELEELRLSGCKIESMEGIEYLPNLKSLELDHTQVKNIDKIKESKSLKEIKLCESEIGNVKKLEKETNIKIIIREEDFVDKMIY